MSSEHIHFVTGRLAAHSLREVLPPLAKDVGFDYTVEVLPITVAALMTPEWIARHVNPNPSATRLIVPGYCERELLPLEEKTGLPVERGPRNLHRLAEHFGKAPQAADFGKYEIEIIAEINHCPRLTLDEILSQAGALSKDGADMIDVGCEPGIDWKGVAEAVRALKDDGYRVSIDSMSPEEIGAAAKAGAELVLSVNSSNLKFAADWGCAVVVVPDDPHTLAGLDNTVEELAKRQVPLRIDPILEPIGFGFARSLGRYLQIRDRYPDAEMMMGIGNLTELTDVDTAGVNALLLGFCAELGIHSILTTQVINWARTSVQECDLARRLVHHAVTHKTLPKHLESGLVMLRDEKLTEPTWEELDQLASDIKDNNYRIFVRDEKIHCVSADSHLATEDPFELMEALLRSGPDGMPPSNLNPSHAFYLGFEMHKALTAITLGKQYEQDEPLDWGFLTRAEKHHYLKKSTRARTQKPDGQ